MSHIIEIIFKLIQERINIELEEEQFGFRKNSGTRKPIFCIRMLIEKYIKVNKPIYSCFIDYTKASDRVRYEQLVQWLKDIHLDNAEIWLIWALYWEQTAVIRYYRKNSEAVDIKRGARQRCVLSPCLFILYTEKIFKLIKDKPGLNINGKIVNNLRYAVGTVPLAENPAELQELFQETNMKSKEYGLYINIRKTKILIISNENLWSDGKWEKETNKRIGMARNIFTKMKHIRTSNQLSNKLKLIIINCYIYSKILYEAETWA
jgi:hypothetical protein